MGGLKYGDVKDHLRTTGKDDDIMLSPFDAAKNLLTSSIVNKMPIQKKIEHFFVDHSLVGLLVQENYLKAVEKKPADSDVMQAAAYAADLISMGDVLDRRIRDYQEWSLLPDVGLASTVYPASVCNGFIPFPSFPAFLGKYSTMSRMRRLSTELRTHLRLSST